MAHQRLLPETVQVVVHADAPAEVSRGLASELTTLLQVLAAVTASTVDLEHLVSSLSDAAREASAEPSPAVSEFLSGIVSGDPVPAPVTMQRVSRAIVGDFERRNAYLDETVTAPEVADLLKISRQAVHGRFNAGKLFGVPMNDAIRFPLWQFDAQEKDGVVPGIPALVAAFAQSDLDPIAQLFWLHAPKPSLENRTPVEALLAGESDAVCAQAVGAGAM